jgi:hypothetical protein
LPKLNRQANSLDPVSPDQYFGCHPVLNGLLVYRYKYKTQQGRNNAATIHLHRLVDTEHHFPQRFSIRVRRIMGDLYNEGTKASHDSKHAVITDTLVEESTLRDIEFFYTKVKAFNPDFILFKGNDRKVEPRLAESQLSYRTKQLE